MEAGMIRTNGGTCDRILSSHHNTQHQVEGSVLQMQTMGTDDYNCLTNKRNPHITMNPTIALTPHLQLIVTYTWNQE